MVKNEEIIELLFYYIKNVNKFTEHEKQIILNTLKLIALNKDI